MRPEEAAWIGEALSRIDRSQRATVLNIGSSTGRFRTVTQPHIDREIFAPLKAGGARIVHCDLKDAEGVDLVGDLLDPAFSARVQGLAADVVLATNLFEHVRDRERLATCLAALPNDTGRLLVSVPYRYPYHADPIDTLFRPTPEDVAGLFPGFALEDRRIVDSTSLWEELSARLGVFGATRDVARRVARLLVPFIRPRAWLATAWGLAWLFRKRSVSIVLLTRTGAAPMPAQVRRAG